MPALSRVTKRFVYGFALLIAASLVLPGPGIAQSSPHSPVPDSAFAHVDSLRADGDFRAALSQLSTLRDRYGEDVGILWRESLTHVDVAKTIDEDKAVKKRYRKALDRADEALAVDSTSAKAHQAKAIAEGRIALDAGTRERVRRSRTVKRHADRAIELDSTLDGAYHTRARWHREVADLGFLERAVVKTIYGGLPEASFEHAVRDFKRAIELHDERLHRLELAKTYMKMDREEDAKKQLRALLELPPQGPFDEGRGDQAQQMLSNFE
jgi:tetratricopeptide (TPR) repeat protein